MENPEEQIIGRVGIDTVAVTVRLGLGVGSQPPFQIAGGGRVTTNFGRATIEASLPKRRHGDNLILLNHGEALEEVGRILALVNERIPIEEIDPADAGVTRIDITQNVLATVDIGDYLDCVWSENQHIAKGIWRLSDGSVTQVILGRQRWSISGYKKWDQSNDDRAKDVLRMEARLHRAMLIRTPNWIGFETPMTTLGAFTDTRLVDIHRRIAARGGFDRSYRNQTNPNEYLQIDWEEGRLTGFI